MSVDATIFSRLSTSTVLTALVGTRITPASATPNTATLPYLMYTVSGGAAELALDGPIGLTQYTIEVGTAAHGYGEVRSVLDATIDTLHGWETDPIQLCTMDEGTDSIELGEEAGFVGTQQYTIWVGE